MKDFIEGEPPKDGRWYTVTEYDGEPVTVRWTDSIGSYHDIHRTKVKPVAHIPEPIPEYKPRPEWLPEGWDINTGHSETTLTRAIGVVAYFRKEGLMVEEVPLSANDAAAIAAFARHMEGGGE